MKKFMSFFILAILLTAGAACSAEAAALPKTFPDFTAPTLDGKTVTQAIFAGNRLTMINFWGTYCPPCIDEMPDLGKLANSMPEGTRLVGIVIDASPDDADTKDEANQILTAAKADFLQILPVKEMLPVFNAIEAVPTTLFVDSEGNIVGEPIVGSGSGEEYRAEIEKALGLLK